MVADAEAGGGTAGGGCESALVPDVVRRADCGADGGSDDASRGDSGTDSDSEAVGVLAPCTMHQPLHQSSGRRSSRSSLFKFSRVL